MRPPSPIPARGQAMTEYLVVVSLCVLILVVATLDPSPLVELMAAIKRFFSAYSYAISVST
ncbi:hypothetical protein CSQ96_08415 [Janthinobacterium sp. BJB412]|nr:hypothetical protein CSQ96_08415 [Janthinobacterium sp. BJB412]